MTEDRKNWDIGESHPDLGDPEKNHLLSQQMQLGRSPKPIVIPPSIDRMLLKQLISFIEDLDEKVNSNETDIDPATFQPVVMTMVASTKKSAGIEDE